MSMTMTCRNLWTTSSQQHSWKEAWFRVVSNRLWQTPTISSNFYKYLWESPKFSENTSWHLQDGVCRMLTDYFVIMKWVWHFDNYDNYLNLLLIKRIILRRLNRTPYLLPWWIWTLPRGLNIHKTDKNQELKWTHKVGRINDCEPIRLDSSTR